MSITDPHAFARNGRIRERTAEQVPPEQSRPRLGVVEGGLDRAAAVARTLGTILLVTFIVGLVGALAVHATIIENQRELDRQRAHIAEIEAQTEALRHELAELEAPARIVVAARDLGMIEPPSVTYLKTLGGPLDERTIIVAENQLLAG